MPRYIERRSEARVALHSPLKLKNLKSGTFSNARMVNYCNNGLCFESNMILSVGAEIILGIENSPYLDESDAIDVYRAKILWRKRVQSIFYKFGYGAELKSDSNMSPGLSGHKDLRKYPRWRCNQSVLFLWQSQPHRGVVKNACPGGLFIETTEPLPVGQTIELTLSDRKTQQLKLLTGEIVRSGQGGIGIRVMKMCAANGKNVN